MKGLADIKDGHKPSDSNSSFMTFVLFFVVVVVVFCFIYLFILLFFYSVYFDYNISMKPRKSHFFNSAYQGINRSGGWRGREVLREGGRHTYLQLVSSEGQWNFY